jgi:nitroreductase
MTFHELAESNRSIRRFRENVRLSGEQLLEFIDAARLAPSGANLQLLRFTPVWEEDPCSRIFPHLNWAGYLIDWDGPGPGERPAAYVILQMPQEKQRHLPVDAGIAAAYIVLSARESGYGSCMIMSFDADGVREAAGSPEGYFPFLVIALGVPGERVVLEEAAGGIEYYRDESGVHHVPKLPLKDLLTE